MNDADPNQPIKKDYLSSALQIEIMLLISLIPNIYFIFLVLLNKSFRKRAILKKSILFFATLYIISGTSILIVMSNYLISYYTTGLINIEICSKLRSLQFVFTTFNSTSLLIYSVIRYILVFFKQKIIIPLMIVFLFCILNASIIIPTTAMWINYDVEYVADDICVLLKANKRNGFVTGLMRTIDTYTILICPLVVVIINFLLLWKAKRLAFNINKNNDRAVLMNLIFQSVTPLLSQFPPVIYYNFGAMMGGFSPIIWKLIDGLTCLSYCVSLFLNIVFIKELRSIVLTHFGMSRCIKVQDVVHGNSTSRTTHNRIVSTKNVPPHKQSVNVVT
uniref:G_PROTEIN_RECEP_F1_2 domain-containing protein n=1 Tax=Rhabditophanes sp. KR3021 TaxID=114890 RepID=A0AC35TIC3_9BILA